MRHPILFALMVLSLLIAGDIFLTLNARERGFSIIDRLDRIEANQRAILRGGPR